LRERERERERAGVRESGGATPASTGTVGGNHVDLRLARWARCYRTEALKRSREIIEGRPFQDATPASARGADGQGSTSPTSRRALPGAHGGASCAPPQPLRFISRGPARAHTVGLGRSGGPGRAGPGRGRHSPQALRKAVYRARAPLASCAAAATTAAAANHNNTTNTTGEGSPFQEQHQGGCVCVGGGVQLIVGPRMAADRGGRVCGATGGWGVGVDREGRGGGGGGRAGGRGGAGGSPASRLAKLFELGLNETISVTIQSGSSPLVCN
jgi:hypothetical protein